MDARKNGRRTNAPIVRRGDGLLFTSGSRHRLLRCLDQQAESFIDSFGSGECSGHIGSKDHHDDVLWKPIDVFASHATGEVVFVAHRVFELARLRCSFRHFDADLQVGIKKSR